VGEEEGQRRIDHLVHAAGLVGDVEPGSHREPEVGHHHLAAVADLAPEREKLGSVEGLDGVEHRVGDLPAEPRLGLVADDRVRFREPVEHVLAAGEDAPIVCGVGLHA
jgi:hypothetical protein